MRQLGIEVFYWLPNWADDQVSSFARAKACGFNAVEISLVSGPDIDVRRIRQALEQNDLHVFCSMGLPLDKDITSPDKDIQRAGVEYLKRCVDTAARVGSPVLCGLPYVPWLHFPAASDLTPYRERSAEAMREVASTASDIGITICTEVINRFETYIFNTVEGGLNYLEMIGHPAVKLQLDTYHMNMEEDDLGRAIRRTGRHLVHFQANENHRGFLGTGHLDWPAICRALGEVRYAGPITLEPFRRTDHRLSVPLAQWRPPTDDEGTDMACAAGLLHAALHAAGAR